MSDDTGFGGIASAARGVHHGVTCVLGRQRCYAKRMQTSLILKSLRAKAWAVSLALTTVGAGVFAGGCATSTPARALGGHIGESELQSEQLLRIFRRAFVEAEVINDHSVRVSLDGIRYQVFAEPQHKLLVYLTHFRFRDDVDKDSRLAFANALNSQYIYTRFSVDGDGDLACEYFLSFKGGIDENQVVDALQLMTNTTVHSIQEADTANLVQ